MELFEYNETRVKNINQFMKELSASENSQAKVSVFRRYEDTIRNISPIDIFYLQNYGRDSKLSIEEIKKTANKFVNVFAHGLEKHSGNFEHILLKTLVKENQSIEEHLNSLKVYYKNGNILLYISELLKGFKRSFEYELKFIKFENIIFPNLENKLPSTKPFEVLWSLHDDARDALKNLIDLLENDASKEQKIIEQIGKYYHLIFGINQKEKLIILPLLEKLVTKEQLDCLYNECIDYGFTFIKTPTKLAEVEVSLSEKAFYQTTTGILSFKELSLIMKKIPLDITFVDKDDRVRYFNDRKERHFPRNPSVIGRLVKHCHPPKSVSVVEKIVEDFKNNLKDFEEFWIEIKGVFLYITYYAIRGDDKQYLGVLEVSQDLTKIRKLQGEKRLVE